METINKNKKEEKRPIVSVLIPVYNAEKTIKQCINSVLNQTFNDFEIVVVDDGSTDNTVNILSQIKDKRIFIYKKQHRGISNALNIGISVCKGQFIARLDADDEMLDYRLELQLDYMNKHQDCDVLSTGCTVKNSDGSYTEYTPKDRIVTFEELLETNNCTHPTIMFRAESLKKLDYVYEPMYDGCEDYKLWFNCVTRGLNIHIISKKTIIYDNTKDQRNTAFSNKLPLIDKIRHAHSNQER